MEKVVILLSTYNGEKYLKEQIESLLNQTYKNIEIFVRDDGSKDNTISILTQYEDKIKIIRGKNKGFIKSFFELLTYCDNAQYYAYCDQDDIWLEDKIEKAVNKLRKMDNNKALLYASNFDYYDSNMEYLEHSNNNKKLPFFRNALVECISPGMTMCINKVARDEIIRNFPETCLYHDWWTYMVCSGIGKVVYDDSVTVKYRRHGKNVTSESTSFIKLQIWRIKTFIIGKSFSDIKKQLIIFNNIYGERLNEEDRKLLKMFINDKFSIKNALKKVFYKHRYRINIIDDMSLRLMFLIGKL